MSWHGKVMMTSEIGKQRSGRVRNRNNEVARAHSSLACCHLSARFFIRFKEPKLFYFTHLPHPEIAKGSMMRTMCPTCISLLQEGPPTRRNLASDTFTPSFSIEKHFVLQPTLCAPIFHIYLTFFDFEYTQDLSLLNLSLPHSCNATADVIMWRARFFVREWSRIRTSVWWWTRLWELSSTRYSE